MKFNENFKTYVTGVAVILVLSLILHYIINIILPGLFSVLESWATVMLLMTFKIGWQQYNTNESDV